MSKPMIWKTILFILIVLAIIFAIGLAQAFFTLSPLRDKIDNQKSSIETDLQNRFNLVSGVLEKVKTYAPVETETINGLQSAYDNYANEKILPQKLVANNALTNAVGKLQSISENYPDMKADQSYIDTMSKFNDYGNNIKNTLFDCNVKINEYNEKFTANPANFFAKIIGFEKADNLQGQTSISPKTSPAE